MFTSIKIFHCTTNTSQLIPIRPWSHMWCFARWKERVVPCKHTKLVNVADAVWPTFAVREHFLRRKSKVILINSHRFFKEWLHVKEAKAPDIINWENLRSSRVERFFRISFTTLLSIVLIAITFVLLLIAQYYQQDIQNYSPVIACPSGIQVT